MVKKFSGEFMLFDRKLKRTMQGNKLRLILKMEENKVVEKKLIDWRDTWAEVTIRQKLPQESVGSIITITAKFEIKEAQPRNSKNGNNLFLFMEMPLNLNLEKEIIMLTFQDVIIDMIPTEPELFQGVSKDDGEEEFEDSEDESEN